MLVEERRVNWLRVICKGSSQRNCLMQWVHTSKYAAFIVLKALFDCKSNDWGQSELTPIISYGSQLSARCLASNTPIKAALRGSAWKLSERMI